MSEAISDMRIDYRWMAIDLENEEIALAKEVGTSKKQAYYYEE